MLAALSVRIHSDSFNRDGGDYIFAQLARLFGVNPATHIGSLKIRRFLVDECNQAHRSAGMIGLKDSRQFEQRRNSTGVIVGSWAVENRIIMSADYHDLTGLRSATNLDNQIAHCVGFDYIFL